MFKERKTMRLEDIKPFEKNPRLNDEAVPFIYNSIKDFGYISEIAVNQDGVILSGHTRLKALKKLHEDGEFERGRLKEQGITADAIPVKVIHFDSEQEETMYRLADNKTAEKAGWDFDMLDDLLPDLRADFALEDYGFDFDLWGSDDDVVDEDEVTGKDPGRKGAEADVYDPPSMVESGGEARLGPHLVVCGPPSRERAEAFAAGRRTLALASADGMLSAEEVKEGMLDDLALLVRDAGRSSLFLRELFGMGLPVTDMIQWDDCGADEDAFRDLGTIVLAGWLPEGGPLAEGGVFEGRDPCAWLAEGCASEGDVVIDLTGGWMGLMEACDAAGRAYLCFCPDRSVCDCIVANWNEARPDRRAELVPKV